MESADLARPSFDHRTPTHHSRFRLGQSQKFGAQISTDIHVVVEETDDIRARL